MNALRSAAAFRNVLVPRVHAAPSLRSVQSHAIAYWHQSPVRPGPHQSNSSFNLPPRPVPLNSRSFRQLSQQKQEKSVPPAPKQVTPEAPTKAAISNAEQRRRDWAIVRRLAVHIWPKNDWGTRGRVVLGVGLLVSGKVRRLSTRARASSMTNTIRHSC